MKQNYAFADISDKSDFMFCKHLLCLVIGLFTEDRPIQ